MLEMTEAPENGHIGIRGFSLKKHGGINNSDKVHLHQCMQHGYKQDELEAIVHQEICDTVAIMEIIQEERQKRH